MRNQPSLDDINKIHTTRTMLAENIESPMVQELIYNTIVRFSIQDNKYILGIIKEVVPIQGK